MLAFLRYCIGLSDVVSSQDVLALYVEFFKCLFNISWHRYIIYSFVIIAFYVQSAICFSIPIYCCTIMLFNAIDEMIRIVLGEIFKPESLTHRARVCSKLIVIAMNCHFY